MMLSDGDLCEGTIMSLRSTSIISAGAGGMRTILGALPWRLGPAVVPVGLVLACMCLLMLASRASASPLTWAAPRLVDHQEPYGDPDGMNSVSCPTASFCIGVDAQGRAVSSTDPSGGAGTWASQVIGTLNDALDDVSCPEVSLCVAVRTDGAILTSTEPTGSVGAWNTATVESGPLDGVSCPSARLCVAAGYRGEIFTATNPTEGASAWTRADVDGSNELNRVSCASTTLCVAVDNAGNVVTSTEPTGGESAWHVANIDGTNHINSVSCPSEALCVAVDSAGNALTSTNPAGGSSEWKSVKIDTTDTRRRTQSELRGISCASAASCVAVDSGGNIVGSNDPTGTAGAWTVVNVDGSYEFNQVSCTTGQCVAADRQGNIVTSTDPLGGAVDWHVAQVNAGTNDPTAVACPSATLCVATDASGNVITTPTPTGGAWSVANIDPPLFEFPMGLTDVSCASQSFCVAVGTGEVDGYGEGNLAISDEPGDGASAWHLTSIDVDDPLTAISCPSESLCVALSENDLETSAEPAAGASTWHLTTIAGNPSVLSGISCPSVHLCVAVATSGEVITSTDPQGGETAWKQTSLSGALEPSAVACPSEELCIVVGAAGQIVTSKDPTGGAAAWTTTRIDGTNRLKAVSCGSPTLCVAVDEAGNALTSSDPTGGEAAWTATHIDESALTGVSCVEESLCVAFDAAGNVVSGTRSSTQHTSFVPAFSYGGLGEGTVFTAEFTFTGTEYHGTVFPSTNVTLQLPAGVGGNQSGFPTCERATLEVSGPAGCPPGSMAGPAGSIGFVSDVADELIPETGTIQAVFAPEEKLFFYLRAEAPVAIEEIIPATDRTGVSPDGPTLTLELPLVEPVPGAPYVSITDLKLALGTSRQEGSATINSVIIPERCPTSGEFTWAFDVTLYEDSPQQATAETACPISSGKQNNNENPSSGSSEARGQSLTSLEVGGEGVNMAPPAPPAPILGQSQTASVISGTVMVRLKGTTKFVLLSGASTIPDGSEVEATNGHVLITVATPGGHTQTAEVWGGRFMMHQQRTSSGETHFTLTLPLTGCLRSSLPHGASAILAAGAKHSSGPKSRHLWVSEHGGSWGTNGRYVSTSVEGTRWLTLDECNRSKVSVAAGKVRVRDLVDDTSKILTAGKSYVAVRRPPSGRR